MSLNKKICVNCIYEDASKTLTSSHPNYPGKKHEMGIATWCKSKQRYIGNNDRQGLREKPDGTFEENIWCTSFVHY